LAALIPPLRIFSSYGFLVFPLSFSLLFPSIPPLRSLRGWFTPGFRGFPSPSPPLVSCSFSDPFFFCFFLVNWAYRFFRNFSPMWHPLFSPLSPLTFFFSFQWASFVPNFPPHPSLYSGRPPNFFTCFVLAPRCFFFQGLPLVVSPFGFITSAPHTASRPPPHFPPQSVCRVFSFFCSSSSTSFFQGQHFFSQPPPQEELILLLPLI